MFNPILVQGASIKAESSLLHFKTRYFSGEADAPQEGTHRIWLNLTSDQGIFKQLLIGYTAGATNGWDVNFDAISLDAYKPADFYSVNENRKLAIQGRAVPLDPADTVPLGYRALFAGNLKISIDHADGDLTNADVYIQDKETGTIHNLRFGPYSFSTLSGTFNNRFVLRYTDKNLDVDEFKTHSENFTAVSKDQTIILNSAESTLREVSVFDISGKLLYSRTNIGTPQLEIDSIQSGTQILLVKTTLENGYILTRKIFF